MAQSTKESWEKFLTDAGIPNADATIYAEAFTTNRITNHLDLTKEVLKDVGITKVGDIIDILKFCKPAEHQETQEDRLPPNNGQHQTHPPSKPPTASVPQAKPDMTHAEFRKYRIDWNVFKSLTSLPGTQVAAHIYSACDTSVQMSIINTVDNFFSMEETAILDLLEEIVTRRSNPSVHRLGFSNLAQSESEPVKEFVVRLKSSAKDCEFTCPGCKFDLAPNHVKDQLIRGLQNSTLQTDILAKSESLKTLEDVVKHSEAFEAAIHDQSKLQDPSDVMSARVSDFKRMNQTRLNNSWTQQQPKAATSQQPPRSSLNRDTPPAEGHRGAHFSKSLQRTNQRQRICPGCGLTTHINRMDECKAWGQNCNNCNTPNHFAKVCRQPKRDSASAIIANVEYDQPKESFTTANANKDIRFVPAEITPMINGNHLATRTAQIFPDSGADICLAGTKHLENLGIQAEQLTPCCKKVTAVGGSALICKGWIQVEFNIGGNTTRQPLYICDRVDRIYFGRQGCTEVNILPKTFPLPMQPSEISSIEPTLPQRPDRIPHSAVEANVPKLKAYLVEKFAETVFNRTTPFRSMNCKPAHIHLKEDAKPHAIHNPFSIPIHWREEVKRMLDKDVEDGIIEPVPIGDPVTWCSPMVVTTKGDGSPRRTVDMQKLNQQCQRETHHCQSPFRLASQIPRNMKKSVLDATDGYHAILLDEESKSLTTFITEWGRYRYLRLPQGYSASQDAYTRRYDEIIKDVSNKVKCIDDTLLYSEDIESCFYSVFDYLTICGENGITINEKKFQFCQDIVTFAGLTITPDGIRPSDKVLTAIRDFPKPRNQTGARSWNGIVNQIAWAYATSPTMQPFRDLVKPHTEFFWDENLDRLFRESKEILIQKCTEGIRMFDINRTTCLQTDWSKQGIGYLLLQQHCNCETAKAPVCCKDGWKLVFAGSRFTTDAETRYAPTEGEALAIAWSLEHARMFVLGCNNLIVSTDHRPLLGILKDRELNSITNPRTFKLKERTLPYRFSIQYNPGKWHRGPDGFSRNPVAALISAEPEDDESDDIEESMSARPYTSVAAISSSCCDPLITISDIQTAATKDATHQRLYETVTAGFPASRDALREDLRTYWNVRDRISILNGMVMMGDRIVVPAIHRKSVLNSLHSAHQGVSSMLSRAQQAVYWPGIDADIRNKRYTCQTCNETAPSNPKEPLRLAPPPLYPYQKICLDYFHVGHHTYLTCVDRFSGWITIFHYPKKATSAELISACRSVFTQNGVAEEVSTDGGPQLMSHEFKDFLKRWGVSHRISSVDYPQSNGRAELAVKSSKRIIRDNTQPNGSLDNDRAARAILQHRNTPMADIGMSPAQLLLHREIRDHIPVNPSHYKLHRNWILAAEEREKLYARRNENIETTYNEDAHTLKPLTAQTTVMIQTKGKWDKSGYIVEALPHRQYRVKVDGSGRVTLRNRRFLKPIPSRTTRPAPTPSSGNTLPPTGSTPPPACSSPPPTSGASPPANSTPPSAISAPAPDSNTMSSESPPESERSPAETNSQQPLASDATHPETPQKKLPMPLRKLLDYNEPGMAIQEPCGSGRTRSGQL